MRISIVVAVAENGVIGASGGLPWRLPSDLKRFKALTMGKPIIMGRKTYESIGRPLPGRDNIVISESNTFAPEGVFITRSLDSALRLGASMARDRQVEEIAVIGGSRVFREAMLHVDRLYFTRVHASPPGDTFFPDLARGDWREVSREAYAAEEGDAADVTLIVFDRVSPLQR
ncbi:dihydrofolate reductase [Rhodoligotrophos appendicifer]|uniref:dihydrofolate reductase n=1 Tax=Rhodoligotrophos appendicifer TaxID=987056 RepID=UPI00118715B7|nr:dihydrofolate reductase [Rhodoligotrophos appendicifer]